MSDISRAPWTDEEVKSLNEFQKCKAWHPFTCGDCGECLVPQKSRVLVATKDGWECPSCNSQCAPTIVQTWAHTFMVNGEWSKNPMIDRLKEWQTE